LQTICDQICLTLFAIHLQGSGHLEEEYLNQDSDFSGDEISDLTYADDEIDVITSTSTERIKAIFFSFKIPKKCFDNVSYLFLRKKTQLI
jgi:hypothetical protein